MNIEDLPKLKQQIEDGLAELNAARAEIKAMHEHTLRIGLSLSEILEHMEKQGPESAKAIADALSGVLGKLNVSVAMPPIAMPPINVPAAQIVMQPAPAQTGWHEIKVTETDNFGNPTAWQVRPVATNRSK